MIGFGLAPLIIKRRTMTQQLTFWDVNLLGNTYSMSPYLLMNGLGLIVGLLLLDTMLQKRFPVEEKRIYITAVFSTGAGWAGAHLLEWVAVGHPFAESGFTFYGGLITGGVFFSAVCCSHFGWKIAWQCLNILTIPLVIAHGIGRLGCFFAGCCHGIPLQSNHILSTLFHSHPTQLYESGFLLLLGVALFTLRKHQVSPVPVYLMTYGIFRFFIEFLRADDRGFAYGLSTSQWISLILVVIAVAILCCCDQVKWKSMKSVETGRVDSTRSTDLFQTS